CARQSAGSARMPTTIEARRITFTLRPMATLSSDNEGTARVKRESEGATNIAADAVRTKHILLIWTAIPAHGPRDEDRRTRSGVLMSQRGIDASVAAEENDAGPAAVAIGVATAANPARVSRRASVYVFLWQRSQFALSSVVNTVLP